MECSNDQYSSGDNLDECSDLTVCNIETYQDIPEYFEWESDPPKTSEEVGQKHLYTSDRECSPLAVCKKGQKVNNAEDMQNNPGRVNRECVNCIESATDKQKYGRGEENDTFSNTLNTDVCQPQDICLPHEYLGEDPPEYKGYRFNNNNWYKQTKINGPLSKKLEISTTRLFPVMKLQMTILKITRTQLMIF